MAVLRRLLVLAAAAVAAGALAQPSFAGRPDSTTLPNTLGTTHFLVHYQSDAVTSTTKNWAITQTQAGDIAALAETAYSAELADGYAAPLSDGTLGGDGRIDIYVVDLSSTDALAYTIADQSGATRTSSYIELDGAAPDAMNKHTIAHELFHVLQLSIWQSSSTADGWLYEASAEWMAYRVDNYSVAGDAFLDLGTPDVSLDCRDPNNQFMCDTTDGYLNGGYEKWPFFEYVTELYGPSFVGTIFSDGAAGAGSATQALSTALAGHGSSLPVAFNNWVVADLEGAYAPKALQGTAPTPYTTVQTGGKSGTVASTSVTINHLAARYVELDRGTGDAASPCFAATLTLAVTIPAGTQSEPVFWWKQDGKTTAPIPLAVSGGTATLSLPWDTCTWAHGAGFLALPNASTSVDAASFGLTATLAVDTTVPASASDPPAPVPVSTPVVPVTATESAPVVEAFGPELLTLDSGENTVRLIVQANAEGSLQAALGSLVLGTVAIRPGSNDVRFRLPAAYLASFRRSAAASLLVLTPVSPQGHVLGAPVLRRIAIAPATKKSRRRK